MNDLEKMNGLSLAVENLHNTRFIGNTKEAIKCIAKVRDAILEELEPPKTKQETE